MSKITSKYVTKPILLTVSIASLVFFGGAVGLTLQSAETTSEQNATAQTTMADPSSNDMALGLDADQSEQSIVAIDDVNSQRLVTINSEQALNIAKPQHANASLIGTPELVNYNGSAAYEVKWTDGVTYVDAALGNIINPVNQTVLVSGSQYDEGYEDEYEEHDDDDYDEDEHDENEHEEYERHEHSERLMVANHKKHDDDEDEYDD